MTDKLAGDPSYEAGRAAHAEATRTPNPGSPANPTPSDEGSRQSGPTPGPWKAVDRSAYSVRVSDPKWEIDQESGLEQYWVALVINEANARLIAAAPDLYAYAEAQEARDRRAPTPWGHNCMWCGPCMEHLGEMRRSALAKADGRV